MISPSAFVQKWAASRGAERPTAQEHFIDLCRLLKEQTPNEADPGRGLPPLAMGPGDCGAAAASRIRSSLADSEATAPRQTCGRSTNDGCEDEQVSRLVSRTVPCAGERSIRHPGRPPAPQRSRWQRLLSATIRWTSPTRRREGKAHGRKREGRRAPGQNCS